MRILLVEDDPAISRFLLKGLAEENHVVDLAEDGEAAEELAAAGLYDAVLLDLLLPGRDGFSVCRRLREQGIDVPVLMLTALDGVPDRVRGLDAGADDYLAKPFSFDELLARHAPPERVDGRQRRGEEESGRDRPAQGQARPERQGPPHAAPPERSLSM